MHISCVVYFEMNLTLLKKRCLEIVLICILVHHTANPSVNKTIGRWSTLRVVLI